MLRHFSIYLAAVVVVAAAVSCKKNSTSDGTGNLFYGKWKTSYNDTIEFVRESGTDYVIYDESMSPTVPVASKKRFKYELGKLHIENLYGLPSPGLSNFRKLATFTWTQTGESFTVQSIEWFMFMSSISTYFTFTRIH